MLSHAKPDERLDLMRVWKETDVAESCILIAAAYRTENTTSLYQVRVDSNFRPVDADSRTNLLKIFGKVLNPMLFDDETADKDKGLPSTEAMDVGEFPELPQKDQSLALPCLYALATGQKIWNESNSIKDLATSGNANIEAWVRAAFVAKDMLAYIGSKRTRVSHFQKFMAESMESILAQGRTLFMEILSKYRVSASTAYLETQRKNRALRHLKEAHNLDRISAFDFCTISIDNYDLTIKGPNPGNDSWVLPLMYYDSRDDLHELGFYQTDPKKRINDVRPLAKDLLTSDLICDPTDYEWGQLSVSVLQCIDTVMRLKLPSLLEAEAMVKQIQNEKKKKNVLKLKWDGYDEIPRDYGLEIDPPKKPRVQDGKRTQFYLRARRHAQAEAEGEEVEQDDQKEQIRQLKGLVQQNKMVVDMPVHENLSKNDTVQGLMYNFKEHVTRIREKDEPEDPSGEHPVQRLMIPISGDGAPASTEFKLKNWDELKGAEEREFEGLQPFAGGFHWMKETLERRASSLLDVVEFFVRVYRETDNMAKQIMAPHDPRQAEEEMPFYLAAFYRAAADEYSTISARTDVSPREVHEHMIARAGEDPFALAVLQDLRFVQIFVLFQFAEKTRSADLFITAVRLILPFLMTANAPNYISIATETLTWWALASDAEKILFENCIMTRKTAKGKPAYLDRIQEMMNTFFRFKVGHHMEPGTKQKMLDAAFGVRDIEQTHREIDNFRNRTCRGLKTAYSSKEVIRHNSIYVQLYVRIRQMNLWGSGAIKHKNVRSSSTCLQLPGCKSYLDSNVLKAYSMGEVRAKKYVETFILDGPTVIRPTTGESGVEIAFVGVSLAKSMKRKASVKTLRTSLSRKEIGEAAAFLGRNQGGPKKQLLKELQLIHDSWESPPDSYGTRISRILKRQTVARVEDFIDCLVYVRTGFFKKHKEKKSEWETGIMKEFENQSQTTKEQRDQIVQSRIYCLSETERANYGARINLVN